MTSILIESAKILVDQELTTANISIQDGKIRAISKSRSNAHFDMKIDAAGLIAIPGMIDAHVHLRDLELAYKETFETGTQAAAAGGFTTVLDMPNTRPPTTTAQRLREKISTASGRLFANVGFQGGLVEDQREMEAMVKEGAIAFKIYLNKALESFDTTDDNKLRRALWSAKSCNALVTVHAEDGGAMEKLQQESAARGGTSIRDFLQVHRPRMEVSAIRRILSLIRNSTQPVHVCHITIPDAVRLVSKNPNATCEATPHHLLVNRSIFNKQGTLAICVPPIRSETDRRGLWQLFSAGRVDILASDHAPHSLEEKTRQNVWNVASGVPGLDTSLPVMFTQVAKGRLSLRRLVEATATLPAKVFQLAGKGAIKEGYDADIVLVDPKAKSIVKPEAFLSKAKYSPFKGMRCSGKAAYTIVNGIVVAERGRIVGPPAGRALKRDG